MKKSTCRALQGPCDAEIIGSTPEEMGENCKRHVMAMVQAGDEAHTKAVAAWKEVSEEKQKKFWEDFHASFNSLPEAT